MKFDKLEQRLIIYPMADKAKMSGSDRETIRNFIQAMIHREANFEPKPDLDKVVDSYDQFVSRLPTLIRTSFLALVKALEMSTIAQGYRHTFNRLSPEEQKTYLNKMETSHNYMFRGIVLGIKTLALIVYFSEPEAEKAVGYDGKCLVEAEQEATGGPGNIVPEGFLAH